MELTQSVAFQPEISSLRKLWRLIPRSQRRQAPLLLLSVFIGTAFEVIGIGLLVPLVNLLTNDSVSSEDSILGPVFQLFGATTQLQMLAVGFLSIGAVVLAKNIYLIIGSYYQNWQLARIRTSVETRMFDRYLHADYSFHLKSNSAKLSQNLITEIDAVSFGVLAPAVTAIVEALTVLGITALLIYIEPVASLALIAFFAFCGITYFKAVSPLLARLGNQRSELRAGAFKTIAEALGGIKQIKILGREEVFQKRFATISRNSVKLSVRTDTMQRIPAYLVELWGVIGLLVVVFTMLLQGRSSEFIVSSLGLFVGASFRFVPALNRVLGASQSLRLAKSAIDVVFEEILHDSQDQSIGPDIHFASEIKLKNISYSYHQNSALVLDGLSLSVTFGESLGIVGPSGVGKTTFVDLLLGLLTPTGGQVTVDGKAFDLERSSWRTNVGYVPQEVFLVDDSIRNNIAFGIAPQQICDERLMKSVSMAQLTNFVSSIPDGLNTITGERGVRLSGGQRQRIGIARALYNEPSLLVLDEATSALDLDTETEFLATLEAMHKKITIISISHRLSTLRYCDRVLRLEGGVFIEVG